MALPRLPLVILDTETTGFLPRVNRVIEFASVRVENGEVIDEFEQLISIPGEIPAQVSALTHIHPADIEGKPPMEEVREEILRRVEGDAIIVGQNVGFDIRMLKGEGIDLTGRAWIDTSMLASLVFPELESYSLGYVSRVLGLHHEPVHRALGDVHATRELLERCWERLLTISTDLEAPLRSIMARAPEGYRRLFDALPPASAKTHPIWLTMPAFQSAPQTSAEDALRVPETGTVQLTEETLSPAFLTHVLRAAMQTDGRHVVAVKNLHALLRTGSVPDGIGIVHPPQRLLDPVAVAAFALQEQYTADEATLALKLAWYEPRLIDEIPVHGDERSVWAGKLACTEQSAPYRQQFTDCPDTALLNHWQLLTIAADPEHPGRALLSPETHIVIDDASMLEDTATKAFGWSCAVDELRAAAEGDAMLTTFTDLLQMWIEKTRSMQDLRYLTIHDLTTPEASGILRMLEELLAGKAYPEQTQRMLRALRECMSLQRLENSIVWIETRQNGNQYLESVPERVGTLLRERMYDVSRTTLLIPPGSGSELAEILPPGTPASAAAVPHPREQIPVAFDAELSVESLVRQPPAGRTVILMSSRGKIEQIFIRCAEAAEESGITLICQNLSGGAGRMQAEFLAAKTPVVWIVTPWTFESVEILPESIDHLVVETLPFDHPSHPVVSRRAGHYQDAFSSYALPRLKHRMYRLLRTFCRYRTAGGDVLLLDPRLERKEYGKLVWKYVESIAVSQPQGQENIPPAPKQKPAPRPKRRPPKPGTKGQLSLFS